MAEQLNPILIAIVVFFVWLLSFIPSVLLYRFQSTKQKDAFEQRTDKLDRDYRESLQEKVTYLTGEVTRLNGVISDMRDAQNKAIVDLKETHNKELVEVERRYTSEIGIEREKRTLLEYRISQLESQLPKKE